MDWTGKQLGNHRLLKQLGHGGFADVYLGEHKHLGRLAAIKILHVQLTGKEEQEFRIEARRLVELTNEHIVPVYDFDILAGVPFLVMAYASNGTLRDRFPSNPSIAGSEIIPYIKQVAKALQFMHNRKLVHRDIKPENILLGPNDIVWLADFGIAVEVQLQMRQTALGTVEYIAPEQLRHTPCPASDQYSLAIIVYTWLCGTPPFTGNTGLIASQHLQTPPPPLRSKNPTISPLIEKVVLQALEKDPQRRFASVTAFVDALERAFEKVTGPAVAVPITPPVAKNDTTIIPGAPPTVRVKQAPGTCLYTYRGHRSFVQTVAWSPAGLRIASGSNDEIHLWDAFTGGNRFVYRDRNRRGQIWSVAWSPDGTCIASGTMRQVASVWTVSTGNPLLVYDGHQESPPSLQFTVRWSADGKYIASGGADKTVQVWDAINGTTFTTYQGHTGEITAVSWSQDSKRVASASDDKTVHVWDAMTGRLAFAHTGHTREVYAVAWSTDGKFIASASRDTTVQIWNATTNDRLLTYTGHERRVKAIAWSPDDRYIASVDDDKIVHVWDVFTGKGLLFCCEGHSGLINALSWSANGCFLASASNDNTVRIWQTMN